MLKIAAAACAAVLVLSSCGSGDEDEAKENIKQSLLEEDSGTLAGAEPTEEQATCLSDGMVDEIGVDKLQEYDLLTEDLTINENPDLAMEEGDADTLAEVFTDCVDMEQMFEDQFASFAGQDQLPEEAQTCIEDAIDEDIIRDGLSATFQGEDEVMGSEVQEKLQTCLTDSLGGLEELETP